MNEAKAWRSRIVGSGEEDPATIQAHPLNWRRHPSTQADALEALLSRVGWVDDVIVNRTTGRMIDGHLRVALALKRKEAAVPVKYVELTEEEERLVLATLDPLAAMAETDAEALQVLLSGVEAGDVAVDAMLEGLASEAGLELGGEEVAEDPGPQIDKAEELREKWGVELGQLWELGQHRLICGDCTVPATVERATQGQADAVLTDPPYGINQPGVPGDDPAMLETLIDGAVRLLPLTDGAVVAFQSTRTFPVWLDAIRRHGLIFERMLSLYKEAQCTYPWRGWIMTTESILVSSRGTPKWQDLKPYAHDAYRVAEVSAELDAELGWHGSVKPVAVVIDILQRICPVGSVVYEPFGGSGTTLIAAEQTGRKCVSLEIAPKYVAITLERWQQMTGKEPYLVRA